MAVPASCRSGAAAPPPRRPPLSCRQLAPPLLPLLLPLSWHCFLAERLGAALVQCTSWRRLVYCLQLKAKKEGRTRVGPCCSAVCYCEVSAWHTTCLQYLARPVPKETRLS